MLLSGILVGRRAWMRRQYGRKAGEESGEAGGPRSPYLRMALDLLVLEDLEETRRCALQNEDPTP